MSRPENIVKNQHHIPQFILNKFSDNRRKLFECLLFEKKIYRTNIKDAMSERYTYEVDELEKNTIEKYFQRLENKISPKFEVLNEKLRQHTIEFKDIKNILFELLPDFLVFYYRSGALLTEYSMSDLKYKIPLMSEKILNHQYIQLLSKTIINCYNIAIIKSDSSFLLSDQFISTAALKIKRRFANFSNRHIGLIETMILIPISSSYYCIFWHSKSPFFVRPNCINNLNNDNVNKINKTIINNAYNKCCSKEKESIDDVISYYRWKSPSNVFFGGSSDRSFGYTLKKEVFFDVIDGKAFEHFESADDMRRFAKVKRNEKCPCSSGFKFKKCHEEILYKFNQLLSNMINGRQDYSIPGAIVIEKPIDQWG